MEWFLQERDASKYTARTDHYIRVQKTFELPL